LGGREEEEEEEICMLNMALNVFQREGVFELRGIYFRYDVDKW
jgi:hypothetical protein